MWTYLLKHNMCGKFPFNTLRSYENIVLQLTLTSKHDNYFNKLIWLSHDREIISLYHSVTHQRQVTSVNQS